MAEDQVAQDLLDSYVRRIENLNEEKAGINADISEIFKEAVGQGFDRKALKKVIQIRAAGATELANLEATVDLYLDALGMVPATRASTRAAA